MPISKTDFVRGLQCEKMLWLDAHAPELKIIPPEVQAKLDAGNDFGDKAMRIFGDYVETTTFREDGRPHFAAMIEKTRQLIEQGTPVICEASFTWYGNFCAADILRKTEKGYALYEVKNTWHVREEFIKDLGFQRLILRKCGVPVTACHLVLRGDKPNPPVTLQTERIETEYHLPSVQTLQTEDFCGKTVEMINCDGEEYRIVNVDKEARAADRVASDRIFELGKLKRKDAPMPETEVGEHCQKPYLCWYFDHCHSHPKTE